MTFVLKANGMDGGSGTGLRVASNDTLIVAVGEGPTPVSPGRVVTSSDGGATWVTQTTPFDVGNSTVSAVCWAEGLGLWVIGGFLFGAGNTVIATSPDAVTWTAQTTPFDAAVAQVYDVVWNGTFLVAVGTGDSGLVVMTSSDAITWVAQSTPLDSGGDMRSVAWSPTLSLFAAINEHGQIITSPDAGTWVLQVDPWSLFPSGQGMTWSPASGMFLASGAGGTVPQIARSIDGVTWQTASGFPLGETGLTVYGIAEISGGSLLAGCRMTTGDEPSLLLSTDGGATWSPTASPFDEGRVRGVGFYSAGGIAVLVGQTDDVLSTLAIGLPVVVPTGPVTPLWRYFIADLDGAGITNYSRLASGRSCEVLLNGPLSLRGSVPSANPQVWITYDGDGYDDPYLAEGTRLLWGFRRESNTPPYYTVRAATIVQLVTDSARQDDATTQFVGWDPWHYLLSRPVVNSAGGFPGKDGLSFTDTQASVVIASLLKWTIDSVGHTFVDAGFDYSGTSDYNGILETAAGMVIDVNFAQGTSVGQAWQQVTNMGVCDIILNPIYDPANRPNYLVELNVFAQAGRVKDEQIFAWNMPGRSLVGLTRQQDGSDRANRITFFAGQGGSAGQGATVDDVDSQLKYGVYEVQQFFPSANGQGARAVVTSLAEQQLALRAVGKETVTLFPAAKRSPRPWQDYSLGDRVPVWASQQKFRQLLGATRDGSLTETQYQRIYGWTANISDDALETIDPLLTSPQGGFTG